MRNYDLSPLYRSAIGFDRMANLINSVSRNESTQSTYPPYNIESFGEDKYRITLAIAGFSDDEVLVEVEQNLLTVKGGKKSTEEEGTFLHQGIAARNFERKFQLDDNVKVSGAKSLHGLLHIHLEREIPEAMKPRKIEIESAQSRSPHFSQAESNDSELKTTSPGVKVA